MPGRRLACMLAAMPNVVVRDLPEPVCAALRRRAKEQGQSLQQYLVAELTRLAERPTTEELFARIDRRRGGRLDPHVAVADLATERHLR